MTIELNKPQIKSLTHALHACMKENPKMKLSEFRENFSKEVNCKDWNTLLGAVSNTPKTKEATSDSVQYDYSDYDAAGILEMNVGRLSLDVAKSIVDIVYQSEFWFLAPIHGGIFDNKQQAMCFIEQHPEMPLSLVVSTNSSLGSVSVIVNTEGNDIIVREEEFNEVLESYRYDSVGSFIKGIPELMTQRAHYDHNSEDSYAIPFLKKNSPFIDYVNSFEYNESEVGILSEDVANAFINAAEKSGKHQIAALDGSPFDSFDDARLFVKTFNQHPIKIISELEIDAFSVSTVISSDENSTSIVFEDGCGLDSLPSQSFDSISDALEGLKGFADQTAKAEYQTSHAKTYSIV